MIKNILEIVVARAKKTGPCTDQPDLFLLCQFRAHDVGLMISDKTQRSNGLAVDLDFYELCLVGSPEHFTAPENLRLRFNPAAGNAISDTFASFSSIERSHQARRLTRPATAINILEYKPALMMRSKGSPNA